MENIKKNGLFQNTIEDELHQIMDSQLKLQVDVSYDTHHKFLTDNGLQTFNAILEIGVGNGYFCCRLARSHPKINFTGIDLRKDMLSRAEEIGRKFALTNVCWLQGDILEDPFLGKKELFDGVIMRFTAIHIPQICQALKLIKNLLKQNGKVWIIDVELNNMQCIPSHEIFDAYKRGTQLLYKKYDIDGHIGSKLSTYLQEAGFKHVTHEIDTTLSNRNIEISDFQRYMLQEARIFNALEPTALTSLDLEQIYSFVNDIVPTKKHHTTYGIVMVSAEK